MFWHCCLHKPQSTRDLKTPHRPLHSHTTSSGQICIISQRGIRRNGRSYSRSVSPQSWQICPLRKGTSGLLKICNINYRQRISFVPFYNMGNPCDKFRRWRGDLCTRGDVCRPVSIFVYYRGDIVLESTHVLTCTKHFLGMGIRLEFMTGIMRLLELHE